jgi:hypothetical protein
MDLFVAVMSEELNVVSGGVLYLGPPVSLPPVGWCPPGPIQSPGPWEWEIQHPQAH